MVALFQQCALIWNAVKIRSKFCILHICVNLYVKHSIFYS